MQDSTSATSFSTAMDVSPPRAVPTSTLDTVRPPRTPSPNPTLVERDSLAIIRKKGDGFPLTGETIDVLGRRVFVPSTPAPPPVKWARFFPGGYNPKYQIPLMGKKMMIAIQAIGGLAILFYGYDQGVMSGVVNNEQFKALMKVDSDPQTARDSAAIGGIVAVYYAGSLFGGLVGGYLGDSIGRVKTTVFGCMIATVGACLQASAMNITWMCIARVISGFGTGHLNAIIPVWSSEMASHDARGAVLAFEVS